MSATKPKPKTSTSSVSKHKSTSTVTISKTSSGGTSASKSHPFESIESKKQLHTTEPIVKDSVITTSTTAKPSKFYFSCRNNEIDTVTSLLPKLTLEEINQIGPNGSTALHAAAYYGNKEIVKLLLSKGVQRMIKNMHGCTPYDEAKTGDIKKLFQRVERAGAESKSRFAGDKGPSYEWIFVKSDPSSYASFNRETIKNNDPTQVVRAYTAETGFYHRVNTDLAQLPTHWSGSKHERNIASIMIFHPVFQGFSFTGETYRGMIMLLEDLQDYVVDTVFMNKTFLSTSKVRTRAESFAVSDESSTVFGVVCKYLIKHTGTALAIEDISEYPFEKEVLILPYASFKVKSVRKSSGKVDVITEIHVEEEDQVKWTMKKSSKTSQIHTSVKKKIGGSQNDDDDSYAKMFKDSQEKGKIDPADLAKWKKESFGIDPETDTYAKIWNDAKKGKFSKSDLAKWKKESGIVTKGADHDDSDLESYDGENDPTIFTASNEQSYATSKTFSSKHPFDMKDLMAKCNNDSND
ncbi:unnamed protein product [Rotaria sp. Silwood2]|nr:unnamed protein product [Rotaria sp. Silwood2]